MLACPAHSVVAELGVLLQSLLWRKPARPKLHLPARQVAELKIHRRAENSRAAKLPGRVLQRIVVSQKPETQAVNALASR